MQAKRHASELLRANGLDHTHLAPLSVKLGKFLIVGGSGVIVNNLALFMLHQMGQFPLVLSSVIAVELAISHNFFWNNRWTFQRKDLSPLRFGKFHLVSLGGLMVNTGTLWLLVNELGVHYLIANLVGIGLATTWNFLLSLVWTWGRD